MTAFIRNLGVVCVLFAGTAAAAEESSLDFFDRDAALSVFDDSIVVVNAGRLKERELATRRKKDRAPAANDTAEAAAAQKAKDGGSNFDPESTSADDITTEFGDPEEKLPMLAVESAPKPFKAMLRALEAGHDDLAFQYARQYVRYIGHVQSQNARLMSMTGKALEREGMAEPGQWKGGPDFVEDQEILERDLERSGIGPKSAGLDDRTREIFEEAKAAEKRADERSKPGGENSIVPVMNDDAAAQALINNESGAASVQQPVDVLFFFSPRDAQSLEMAPEIESLHRSGRPVNVVGFVTDGFNLGEAQRFKSMTRTTFLIRDGAKLAQSMKLTGTPTVVVTDPRTGKTVSHGGIVRFTELEQIIKSLDTGR
ncbi:MAG: hypothetical protein RL417_812 [Pseudomonadota bacterium]